MGCRRIAAAVVNLVDAVRCRLAYWILGVDPMKWDLTPRPRHDD